MSYVQAVFEFESVVILAQAFFLIFPSLSSISRTQFLSRMPVTRNDKAKAKLFKLSHGCKKLPWQVTTLRNNETKAVVQPLSFPSVYPHSCLTCGDCFKSRQGLVSHSSSKHGIFLDQSASSAMVPCTPSISCASFPAAEPLMGALDFGENLPAAEPLMGALDIVESFPAAEPLMGALGIGESFPAAEPLIGALDFGEYQQFIKKTKRTTGATRRKRYDCLFKRLVVEAVREDTGSNKRRRVENTAARMKVPYSIIYKWMKPVIC